MSSAAGKFTPIRAERVILRQWIDSDRDAFAALSAHPEVMKYFPARLSRAESDGFVDRAAQLIADNGWGLWAVEHDGGFIGFTGLSVPSFAGPFPPGAVEVGWRLARSAWGQGFATEAAEAALDFGLRRLGLPEIVSFTSVNNRRSRAVMQRIGMTHDPNDDFEHPRLPAGHPLRAHVLYRLSRPVASEHAVDSHATP